MDIKAHNKVTGFSGNEIYCLNKLGYNAGQLCLGNNVIALGVARGIGALFIAGAPSGCIVGAGGIAGCLVIHA